MEAIPGGLSGGLYQMGPHTALVLSSVPARYWDSARPNGHFLGKADSRC